MLTAGTSGLAKGARRRWRLLVKDFWLYRDGALDRVRNETIFFSLLQNPWHPAQVADRSNHYSRFNHNRGYLVTAPWHFLERTLGCRRKAHQWQLGILSDSEKRKHKAGVDRGNKKMFRRTLTFSPFELWRSADTDGWKSGPFYPSLFFFGPLNFCFVIEHSWFAHFSYSFGSIIMRTQFNHSDTFPVIISSSISLQSCMALSMTFGSLEWDAPCLTAPCRARTTCNKCSSSFSMLWAGCGI